ncbi:MAG: chromosomal replication initiator protein DnaA [Candidatus Levybacteria bacterium RIFCSPLOWO2_01_FULL_38_13]|nr:MAG: chromosomal replication initiator protein DnaA [Candidatus Levybacteria bacterium RIFCSPHIGHO2_01_FULL_41_15]OGH35782.1 MAG: chromosomal replication initiator protein DnaA [Candidatus Levybacteria bacterium RIFCSPLOWO2_01_FULL_38_13]
MQDNNQLWKIILNEIETEVSKANFLTLFKNTSLLSFEDNVATISAPSTMVIDLLQKRFYQVIKKSLDKHLKGNANIIFVPKAINKNEDIGMGPLFVEVSKTPLLIGHLPKVRKDYTFDTLAVSSSNQLAYVSAQSVAKKPGSSYNPLFIYGPVGVGKTHLMHAIANHIYKETPGRKIVYITSEEFTNEVVEAIRTNDTARMKRKFRNTDILIIDDVQFLAGKEKIQEELFHTFNTLVDKESQIVLSSDRPPSDIKKMEKRLSSRFSGGLTVDIEPPDFELRTAILLIKAKKYNFDLPIEVAKTIAEKILDTRSLEGNLLRLMTEMEAQVSPIDVLLDKILKGETQIEPSYHHPDEIIKNLCNFYRIKPTQIKSQKRSASLVRVRQIAMYLLRKELGLSLVEIGNILGGRDHTTIMYGVDKIENLLVGEGFSDEIKKVVHFSKTGRTN